MKTVNAEAPHPRTLTEAGNAIRHKTHTSAQESSHISGVDCNDLKQLDQPGNNDGDPQPYDDDDAQGIIMATAHGLGRVAEMLKRTSTRSSFSSPPAPTTFQLAQPSSENVNLRLAASTATGHNHGSTVLCSSETSPLPTTKIGHVAVTCGNEEAF